MPFLVDTSVLRVFSSIDRLDLLAYWSPFSITHTILREHGQAPPHAAAALSRAINAGQVQFASPVPEFQVKLLDGKLGLGYCDCEGILVAERDRLDGIFVADKNYREACRKRGIQTAAVGSVLLHLLRSKKLSKADATRIAASMEASGYYRFPDTERFSLGI